MKNLTLWGTILVICFTCSGCASIICGSEKTINIASDPTGAEFAIKNPKGDVVEKGITPENVTLKRGRGWFKAADYTISMEKAGFKPYSGRIEQPVEWGWYGLGNLVFGGLIGYVILDPWTGGMYGIEDVNMSLQSKEVSLLYSNDKVKVVSLDSIPTSLQSKMVRIN